MSISAVSLLPRHFDPNTLTADPRLKVNNDENCWMTAMKVAGVIATVIASIASFVFLGPLLGLAVTLVLGTGALLIFNSHCVGAHNHTRHDAHLHPPLYQRVFSFIPTGGFGNWSSYFPSGVLGMNNDGHVRVGGGHRGRGRGNHVHVPVGRGHDGRGGGHVPVGRGHNPQDPHAHGHGRGGPTNVPPPSGPAGHVPPGRGHFH